MTRVAIAEDDPSLRAQLSLLLEAEGYEPCPLERFDHTVDALLALAPDLVLLDLGLPDKDGVAVCRELRRRSALPVIVVTSRDTELDEVACMRLGADDFLAKPFSARVLLARIEAVLRRASPGLQLRLTRGPLSLDLEAALAEGPEGSVELTKNEFRILACLMRHGGRVVSRSALMEELWSTDCFVDDNTLTVNVNRLRRQLDRIGCGDMLKTRRGQGYLLP